MDGANDADDVNPTPDASRPPDHSERDVADGAESAGGGLGRLAAGLRLVSVLTLMSRLLGLIRDMLMAACFGNSAVLDAFTVAFRIPNMARRLFGEGALTAAFLPLFVRESEQVSRNAAWQLASGVLFLLAIVLSGLVLAGEALLLVAWLSVGHDPEIRLLVELTAIMLPYLITICLAAQVSAILNAQQHFAWPALVPTLLNTVWIAVLVLLVPHVPPAVQMHVVAVGIVIGGVLQLLAPWPTLRRLGFVFQLDLPATRSRLKELVRAMVPVLVGISVTQLNTIADSLIAWFCSTPSLVPTDSVWSLEVGTASALYFGQRMYQFPLGIFGVALGTVLFPRFSRHASHQDWEALRTDLSTGLELIAAIGLPASAGLVLLAEPLTRVLFEHGEFTDQDSRQTMQMIIAYSTGVWAYCGLLIVSRAFYAVNDRMTPLRSGVLALCLNLPLNFVMIRLVGAAGLALATSLSAAFQIVLLTWQFHQRLSMSPWRRFGRTAGRVFAATVIMTAVGWALLQQMPRGDGTLVQLMRTLLPLIFSTLTYFLAARMLRIDVLWLLFRRDRDE